MVLSRRDFVKILHEKGFPFLALILGDRGAGKTNLSLLLAELAYSRGLNVDILLPGSYTSEELPPRRRILKVSSDKEFREYLQGLRNTFVLIDEGLIALNARNWRNKLNLRLAKLSAVGRHRDVYIVITSQAHRIDVQVRELADAIVVKKTDTSRLLVLDRPPRRLKTLDRALRVFGKTLDTLEKQEAARIGRPITDLIVDIPRSRYSHILDKRARDAEIDLRFFQHLQLRVALPRARILSQNSIVAQIEPLGGK